MDPALKIGLEIGFIVVMGLIIIGGQFVAHPTGPRRSDCRLPCPKPPPPPPRERVGSKNKGRRIRNLNWC